MSPGKGFYYLLSCPLGCGMLSYTEMDSFTTTIFRIIIVNNMLKLTDGMVKKSIETVFIMWFFKKALYVWEESFHGCFGIRLEIDLSDISILIFNNSPWILGAPHNGLAIVMILVEIIYQCNIFRNNNCVIIVII